MKNRRDELKAALSLACELPSNVKTQEIIKILKQVLYATEVPEDELEDCINLSNQQALRITTLQAKIDELMLEYCPEDMTKEQLDNWALHQRAFP